MGEEEKGRGFAGLESVIPDVDKLVSQAKTAGDTARLQSLNPPSASSPSSPVPSSSSGSSPRHSPAGHGGPNLGVYWMIGGVVIVLLAVWVGNSSDKKTNTPPYTPPVAARQQPQPSLPATAPMPPLKSLEVAPTPARRSAPVTLPPVSIPPVGTSESLGSSQIRYCVFESVRLEVLKDSINDFSQLEVSLFNASVSDYNSRCGRFRYRRGTLEPIQAEAVTYRRLLELEALERLNKWR